MPKSKAAIAVNLTRAIATLDRMKLDAGCTDCGYRKSPAALHFDHLDPATKRADLGWVRDRSKLTSTARLRRYLDHVELYCVIRCANCHTERSEREGHWLVRRDPSPAPEAALF